MTNFNVFKNLVVEGDKKPVQAKSVVPEGDCIRVHSTGRVYPSVTFGNKWDLQFRNANEEWQGNAIDITDSATWDKFKDLPRVILASVVPKGQPKVELFSSCRRDDQGNTNSSVYEQGPTSNTLLKLVRELGFLKEGEGYVDLVMLEGHAITFKDGIANVPKKIERGPNAGQETYVRRENVKFYPMTTVEHFREMSTVEANEVVVDATPVTESNLN